MVTPEKLREWAELFDAAANIISDYEAETIIGKDVQYAAERLSNAGMECRDYARLSEQYIIVDEETEWPNGQGSIEYDMMRPMLTELDHGAMVRMFNEPLTEEWRQAASLALSRMADDFGAGVFN